MTDTARALLRALDIDETAHLARTVQDWLEEIEAALSAAKEAGRQESAANKRYWQQRAEQAEAEVARLRAVIAQDDPEGVWCCERRHACEWQGFALHRGLGWGVVPSVNDKWRQFHDRHCGGTLIQLIGACPRQQALTEGR